MFASRRPLSVICLLSCLCLVATLAQAQSRPRGGSTGVNPGSRGNGPTQLEIQITDGNSRNLEMQCSVELVSSGSRQPNNRTFTDTNGRTTFAVPASGTFQVRVSGPYIEETTSETFWIQPGEMLHHETIPVKLKSDDKERPAPAGATISASQLNIPEKARKEFDKGTDAMHKQDWKKAQEHFTKAAHDYPKYDWAYNSLGVVDMKLGEKDNAREAFSRAVDIDSHNIQADRNLARILIQDGDFAKAEQLAKEALAVQPKDPDALTLEAFAQLKQRKYDDAIMSARLVHTSEKHAFPFAHLIAAHALEAKNLNVQAAAEYRAFLTESPDTPEAHLAKEGLQRTSR
jgi:tetratricopeptide (TPR) repeat protein